MATVQTKYLGDLRTESVHLQSGNKLITDAPTDNQGRGEAFSPTDLLATAFGACVLTIMGIAAKTHGFDIDGTEVETTKVMGTEPRRIVELITTFKFPHNNYSAKHKKILELTAKECPVFNSLHPDIKKTVSYCYPDYTSGASPIAPQKNTKPESAGLVKQTSRRLWFFCAANPLFQPTIRG